MVYIYIVTLCHHTFTLANVHAFSNISRYYSTLENTARIHLRMDSSLSSWRLIQDMIIRCVHRNIHHPCTAARKCRFRIYSSTQVLEIRLLTPSSFPTWSRKLSQTANYRSEVPDRSIELIEALSFATITVPLSRLKVFRSHNSLSWTRAGSAVDAPKDLAVCRLNVFKKRLALCPLPLHDIAKSPQSYIH